MFFYWDTSAIATLINDLQVKLVSYMTNLTLVEGQMQENRIVINPSLVLIIDKACNGLIPYYFFLASIIAFPSTLIHTIKWAVIGYVALFILNIFRIWFITQLVSLEEDYFVFAHDIVGNVLLLLGALGLFIGFIQTQNSTQS